MFIEVTTFNTTKNRRKPILLRADTIYQLSTSINAEGLSYTYITTCMNGLQQGISVLEPKEVIIEKLKELQK